jgi:hypothetical protein
MTEPVWAYVSDMVWRIPKYLGFDKWVVNDFKGESHLFRLCQHIPA